MNTSTDSSPRRVAKKPAVKPKTLENIKPINVKTGKSWGSYSRTGKEVKVAYIRRDGLILCRSGPGDRFTVLEQIAELKRTDGAGKGWQIEQIFERQHTPEGQFIERTYSGEGLDYLFAKLTPMDRIGHIVSLVEEFKKERQLIHRERSEFNRSSLYFMAGQYVTHAELKRQLIEYSLAKYPNLVWPALGRNLLDQCQMIKLEKVKP